MRRLLSVLSVLIGVAVIAACGDSGAARTPTAPGVEHKAPATPVPPELPTVSPTPVATAVETPPVATAVETPPVVASPTSETPVPPPPPTPVPTPTLGREGERCESSLRCAQGLYCEHPVGSCYGAGTCKVIPQVCVTVWAPVCGCDHVTYGNTCEAAMAAVSIASTKECTSGH